MIPNQFVTASYKVYKRCVPVRRNNVYNRTVYTEYNVFGELGRKEVRDGTVEISGSCIGMSQISFVRELEPNALESNKPATEGCFCLNSGGKFDFHNWLLAIIIDTLFYFQKCKPDGDTVVKGLTRKSQGLIPVKMLDLLIVLLYLLQILQILQ